MIELGVSPLSGSADNPNSIQLQKSEVISLTKYASNGLAGTFKGLSLFKSKENLLYLSYDSAARRVSMHDEKKEAVDVSSGALREDLAYYLFITGLEKWGLTLTLVP